MHKSAALTLGALGLLAAMTMFAAASHAFTLTSSPSVTHAPTTTSTSASCVADVQQEGNYSGQFGCQDGPDSGTNSNVADGGAPELEP